MLARVSSRLARGEGSSSSRVSLSLLDSSRFGLGTRL